MSDVPANEVPARGAVSGAPYPVSHLELAAMLCSRLCHDVISPVGAIVNGIEVLEDKDAADMREVALDLIAKSARQASARLQFTRLAFGAAGSVGAQLDLGDAEQVVCGMIEDDRTKIEWKLPREFQPKNQVKLLLNLTLLSSSTIPRGGVIRVEPRAEGDLSGFVLVATGTSARIPQNVETLLAGQVPESGLDAHVIQPFYAGMLARECNMVISFIHEGDTVRLIANPA